VRTIAIGAAAVSLLFVAAAYGSQQATSQNALRAPRPAGAPAKKTGLVEQVACTSAKSCAAIGTSLYTKQDGKWSAVGTPTLPHTGGTPTLMSLACPAAGHCEAVGIGGVNHAMHLTENGRAWRSAEFALPANAAPSNPPSGPFPGTTIACAAAGDCTAVGHYVATDHTVHALLVSENGGTWGAASDVPLPPDASTTFPPPDGVSSAGGFLSSASCPSAGNCTTLGSYARQGTGGAYPWDLDERGGQWASGAALQLPADAATTVDSRGGDSPFLGFSGLSCLSAGNCTAVGGYVDKHSDFQGVIFTERDGTWSQGIKAAVPPGAGHNTDAMELFNPLSSVSCATLGDCAAVGFFVKQDSELQRGLLLAEHRGTWKASSIRLPKGADAGEGVDLTSVACPSSGNCIAVGFYDGGKGTHGLIVRERGGKWQRAVNAAVPKDAAPAGRSHTFLLTVTCPSKTACTAGGYYNARSGGTQGLLLDLRLR